MNFCFYLIREDSCEFVDKSFLPPIPRLGRLSAFTQQGDTAKQVLPKRKLFIYNDLNSKSTQNLTLPKALTFVTFCHLLDGGLVFDSKGKFFTTRLSTSKSPRPEYRPNPTSSVTRR